MLLPLLTWLVLDPSAPKWVFEPRQFGTTFSVVSAKICRFSKTVFGEIQARHQKKTNMRRARQHKYILPFFQVPGFGPFHRFFQIGNLKNPFSPQFWACPPSTEDCDPDTDPKESCASAGQSPERPSPEASFAACRSKTTPRISGAFCGNCCAPVTHETL